MRKNNVEEKEQVQETIVETPVMPWEISKDYSICQDLYVWTGPGEDKAAFDNLPEDIKEIAFEDDFGKAILNAGARVTVEDVKEVDGTYWIKLDCGWICGKNPKITYVS